ncbi:chromate transporter [Collimonas sp. OK412]|jgi:chromate transporter|uniref:chromate transporter n=1 Tax=Collimonas sp. (strain OK412) TaxID=1801619 RepID=UPI0008E27A1F|nr:chromate transporter [Collimonas sp. OK412]SFD22532.1 chromate transporter [Collimonas sp. OK412]
MDQANKPTYTLWQLILYFLRLGTFGFGGPVALVGYMHRDLVERRGWISESDYKEGLALAQIAPGPLAAQLGIYLGFVHFRLLGATVAGLAFVLPSFLMVVALGWAYVAFGGLTWMQSVFYGVGASVIGIMAISAHKLASKNLGRDKLLWGIFILLAAVTIITQSEIALLFIGAGVLVWVIRCKPRFGTSSMAVLLPTQLPNIALASATDTNTLIQIVLFFTKAGAFVFGSGLAIVPFLYSGVVTEHHWLSEKQFVDAVAVAMITPGPVVITTGFIGYLISGLPGAVLAAVGTFVPCYLATVIAAPYFKKYGKLPALIAFVDGITAAAIGAIAGSVVVIAQRSIIDMPTALLALATAALLWKFKKLPEPVIVIGAALVGIVVYPLLHH